MPYAPQDGKTFCTLIRTHCLQMRSELDALTAHINWIQLQSELFSSLESTPRLRSRVLNITKRTAESLAQACHEARSRRSLRDASDHSPADCPPTPRHFHRWRPRGGRLDPIISWTSTPRPQGVCRALHSSAQWRNPCFSQLGAASLNGPFRLVGTWLAGYEVRDSFARPSNVVASRASSPFIRAYRTAELAPSQNPPMPTTQMWSLKRVMISSCRRRRELIMLPLRAC